MLLFFAVEFPVRLQFLLATPTPRLPPTPRERERERDVMVEWIRTLTVRVLVYVTRH